MPGTKVPLAYRVYQSVWTSLDWLLPPSCASCGASGHRWCPDCHNAVKSLSAPLCEICGIPHKIDSLCLRCQGAKPSYAAVRSWGAYAGTLRKAIHQLKYRRDVGLGETLARLLQEMLADLSWPVDLVIPVPLAKGRLAERGYNQSALLARPLALYHRLPYRPKALARVRETDSQIGLTLRERRQNVRGAFRAKPAIVQERSVLLVDDVMTTGATMHAGAKALLDSGAANVYGLTLARALGEVY